MRCARTSEIGSRVGVLYAVNTVGRRAGHDARGLRAAARARTARDDRRRGRRERARVRGRLGGSRSAPALPPAGAEAARGGAAADGRARWILPLILVSGFVSFTYEVLWVRLLGHVLGSSAQAFATMLASFLAGIAIGAAIASRLATHARARRARIRAWPSSGSPACRSRRSPS